MILLMSDYGRLHRATWTSTELFLTFPPPALNSITIIPLNAEDTAGRFRVWLTTSQGIRPALVWDRKVEGKFPELKELVCSQLYSDFDSRRTFSAETAHP